MKRKDMRADLDFADGETVWNIVSFMAMTTVLRALAFEWVRHGFFWLLMAFYGFSMGYKWVSKRPLAR